MKAFRYSLFLLTTLFLSSVSLRAATSQPGQRDVPAERERQLAEARKATAHYHDPEQALADGYINLNLFMSGEGFHFLKPALVDGIFDPAHPEVLIYAQVPGETRLQLVAVEYLVPLNMSSEAPAGFAGDLDVWRKDEEGLGFWELNVWIWLNNPYGVFANTNPRVP